MTLCYKIGQIVLQNATAILLQDATAILLQNASGFLLQNATVITNCNDFITKCGSYYKMRRLLQIATVQKPIYFATFKTFHRIIDNNTILISIILRKRRKIN